MEYLADLLKEKELLARLPPNIFLPHTGRLIDAEIVRVRASVFQCNFLCDSPKKLPNPKGEMVTLTDKVYVPLKDFPEYNFVGRILGPRGMTAKQLEQETGCKIMIRGKGSMRDHAKEKLCKGKPSYEHLDDDLHVLIQCEDTKERAKVRLSNAVTQIKKLLVPPESEGIDELKRKQLMELAIINGTYRPANLKYPLPNTPRLVPVNVGSSPIRRSPPPQPMCNAQFSQSFFESPMPSPTDGVSSLSSPMIGMSLSDLVASPSDSFKTPEKKFNYPDQPRQSDSSNSGGGKKPSKFNMRSIIEALLLKDNSSPPAFGGGNSSPWSPSQEENGSLKGTAIKAENK